MTDDKFKISLFKIDDPQELVLMYDTFKEDTMYPGNWSTKVKHRGVEKWWKVSSMVYDNVKGLGLKAGDKFFATRREGKKGSYTEVSLPNDIQNAPQNRQAASRSVKNTGVEFDDSESRIPMEAYSNDFKGHVVQDPIQDRIIFGMSGNQAAAMMRWQEGEGMPDLLIKWERLRDELYKSNKKGPPNTSLPFSN